MADINGLKCYFRNVTQNPATDLCELLGAVEEMRAELHDRLEQTEATTAVDNGGPITLRCEQLDGID